MTEMDVSGAVPRSIMAPSVRKTSVGILILITLIAFEAMAVNAALPTAARELDGLGAYGWAFTGFLVANVVGMVVSGQASDQVGAARPLLAGLAAFTVGLVVGGTATTMAQLIGGRVVQGFGAGLIITAIYVVIGQLYPDALRPGLFAAISSAWVVPGLVGPPLSGLLAEHLTWRLVFVGLAPFVVLGGLLLVPVLRSMQRPTDPAPGDPQRIWRALAVAGGVAAFASAGQHPSLLVGSLAVVGLAALVWGLRRLLPPGTVRVRPGVAAPVALRGLFAGAFFGMEALVPLSLTVQHDFGPTEAGLPLTVTGITWFLGSWWQGRRVDDDGTARRVRLMRVGFALVTASALGMTFAVLPGSPGWLAYPIWGLGGFGAGLTMASIGILLLRYTSDETRGNDSAALQLADGTSSAITTAVGGMLVAAAARGAIGDTAAFVSAHTSATGPGRRQGRTGGGHGVLDWVSMSYLDHAATTPMLPEAVHAVAEALGRLGNPSSLHGSGRRARRTIEESREALAEVLGARPSEVILTAGGTESDNLAVKGIYWSRRAADPRRRRILAGAVDHHAVMDSVDWLVEHEGAEVTWLQPDTHGLIGPETLRAAIAQDPDSVALVTVMWANNEVGTIMPIAALAEVAHEHGIPVHTDAVQAVPSLAVDFAAVGVDALTMTGHKLGGPIGAGALLLRRDVACTPLLHGGGQEREVRSGTLDVPGAVGLSTATVLSAQRRPETVARIAALREELVAGVLAAVPDARVHGHPTLHLPGIANITFPGCEGDALMMLLDAQGVECSTGSACSAGVAKPSHVLVAMGADAAASRGSLRFSLGHDSCAADIHRAIETIGPAVERARKAGLTSMVSS